MSTSPPLRLFAVTIASAVGALLLLQPAAAQQSAAVLTQRAGERRVLRAGPGVPRSFVRARRVAGNRSALTASAAVVNVTYTGFTPEAQAAFQYAVDLWKTQITASVPITISATFQPLGQDVLGQAGPTVLYRDFPNAPQSFTWYPAALANQLAGRDLDAGIVDIDATFSSTFGWYFGTDGATPPGSYDFVSVVMHEIGHGLGFLGSGSVAGGLGTWGFGTIVPSIFDRFVRDGSGNAMLNTTLFPRPSGQLLALLTSNDLYWGGGNGVAANNGMPPRLYAPFTWTPGSSFSHLDEATYPAGDPNSLMTPMLASTEAIHDPGPIVRGMFADMGWASTATCTFALSPSAAAVAYTGGSGAVTLTTQPGCSWEAVSTVPWLSVSPAEGTGTTTLTYVVAAQTSSVARMAQLTVADAVFTVSQAGVPCAYTLTPATDWVSPRGATRPLTVTTSVEDCSWALTAAEPWLSVAASGTGTRSVTYAASANAGSAPRTGTISLIGSSGVPEASASITQPADTARPAIDFDGNGLGDVFLYDPATGAWRIESTVAPGVLADGTSGLWATGWTIMPARFNDDAFTDLFLYNPVTGRFFKALSLGNGEFSFFGYTWAAGWTPVVMDLDGDGVSDVFLYNRGTGQWFRCITTAAADFTYDTGRWAAGWTLYPADFNGDGLEDLFLYNANGAADANSGRWFRVMSTPWGAFEYIEGDLRWAPGWQITPADFDGDGRSDLFLYRGDGLWFQVFFRDAGAQYAGGTWAPGWQIRVGAFDADGTSDLFLYNPVTGQSFVVLSGPGGAFTYVQGILWAPGWEVSLSDFDGDGISDVFLYNPANGTWFEATSVSPAVFSYTTGTFATGLTAIASGR